MATNQKVAVVTGSSTGIGFETSLELAKNGFHTYATVRNLDEKSSNITEKAKNENLPLQAIQLDVNNEKSAIEGINKISEEKGRIDVAVNNAGYDLMGPLEETSMDEIKAQFWSYEGDASGNTHNEKTKKVSVWSAGLQFLYLYCGSISCVSNE